METLYPCLGLKILGLCKYDPASPSISYFSLGEAIAAIALVGIFYERLTPKLRFRIRLYPSWFRTAIGCFSIGVFLPFLAALPMIGYPTVALIGYPIFWELIGAFLIFVAVIIVIIIYISEVQFNKKNHHNFVKASFAIIAQGDKEAQLTLADDLFSSCDNIIIFAKKFDRFKARRKEIQGEQYEIEPVVASANRLFALLSDRNFCTLLATKKPGVVIKFLDGLRNCNYVGNVFIDEIAAQALLNPDSILSREEDYQGLGFFRIFTTALFGHYNFLEHYRPLQAWQPWRKGEHLTITAVENYCKALKVALKNSLSNLDGISEPAALYVAIEALTHPMYYLIKGIKNQNWDSSNIESEILNLISSTFKDILDILKEEHEQLQSGQFAQELPQRYGGYYAMDDRTIFGVIANGIYKFLKELASWRENDDFIRSIGIHLWVDVFPPEGGAVPKPLQEIQKRVWALIEKQMKDNLTSLGYPMITRLMINFMVLDEESIRKYEVYPKICALLAQYLKSAFELDEKKAHDLLPTGYSFNPTDQTLHFVHPYNPEERILDLKKFKDS